MKRQQIQVTSTSASSTSVELLSVDLCCGVTAVLRGAACLMIRYWSIRITLEHELAEAFEHAVTVDLLRPLYALHAQMLLSVRAARCRCR